MACFPHSDHVGSEAEATSLERSSQQNIRITMAEAEFNVIGSDTVAKDAMPIDTLAADVDAVAVAADALATEKLHADVEVSIHHEELVEEKSAHDAMDRDEADTNFLFRFCLDRCGSYQ